LKVQPSRRTSISVLLIAVALVSLTGCQLLGNPQSKVTETVVVGNASLDFGTVGVGNSKTLANTLSNFKTSTVTISSVSGLTPDFQLNGIAFPLVLATGQEASFTVVFQPNAAGKPSPTVTFDGDGQNYASMTLSGNAVAEGQLALNPGSVTFGNVKTGKSQTTTVTLSNSGSTDLTINQATLSGTGFSMGSLALPLTLPASQSTTLSVTFTPPNGGNFSGSVSFNTTAVQAGTKRKLGSRRMAQAVGGSDVVVLALQGAGVSPGTLSAAPASLAFGSVQVGKNASLAETLTNTGGSNVTISQANITGAGFSISGLTLPATLTPNQSVAFTATFAPTAVGSANGSLAIISDASNSPLNIGMSGTAVAQGVLVAAPASLAFGNVQVSKTASLSETLTNTGGSTVTISQANVTGAGFSISGLTLPATLTPNQSVSFTATFAPTATGAVNGTLAIISDAPNSPLNIALSGTGVTQGQLTPNPASLSFGNVQVGGSKTLTETLTNSGGSSLTISAASATGSGFSLSGLTLPLTLNAGQSTTFNVQFAPAAAGNATGNVNITSNGANQNLAIPVSGDGVTPGTLSANPASLAFGSVQVGNSTNLSETLTNTGGSTVTISQANVTGAGFSISGLALPATLNPNQSVTFTATFAPAATGTVNGTLAIVSTASNSPLNIALSGRGLSPGSLTATPSSVLFGNVLIGSSPSVAVTLTNTGGSSVTISNATVSGTGFSFNGLTLPLTLPAGQTTSFNVVFAPAAAGSSTGTVVIDSNAVDPTLDVALSGTGVTQGQITPNPTSLSFGNVVSGGSKTLTETLTNSGGTSLTISAATASGSGFTLSGLNLPLTLTAGQSTTFSVQFAPTAAGSATGNVNITSNGANPSLDIALSGTGVTPGTLSPNPASLAFGNVQTSKNASLSETLTNTGGSAVTISQANVTGAGYSVSGLTLPATVNPSQSVRFTVTFAPTVAGAANGTLAIVSDASNSPLNITLSGTGVTPGQLSANPASLAFGNVQTGNSSNLSETLTNTGGSAVTITQANVTGAGYSVSGLTLPATLNPTQTVTFTVTFAPTAAGAVNGTLAIVSNASNSPLNIALSGTGITPGQLSANPASLAFGNVQVGSSANLSETLTNTGGTAVTISQATVTGAGFSISGLTLPATLNPTQSVTFTATFTPTAAGAASGTLAIVSNASNSPLNIALSGTGITLGQLSANPASLAFGNVQTGNSSNLSETLTNTGGSAVTITQANVTGAGYSVSGLTLPATLNPTQTVTFAVTFAPTSAGAVNGTLAIVSNASNSPLNIALSGTGVTPGQLSANPASLAFGSVQVGSSANLSETLTNSGGTAVTISQANVTGTGFSISGLTLPTTLNPTQSVTFTATFTPTAAGAASGTLAIVSNASNSPLNIALSGTGTAQGQLSVSPATLSFGNVVVGANASLNGSLTATGASVTISAGSSNSSEFVLSGITFPKTLAAGGSASFTVKFTPQATGAASASLTFTSNASNSPTVETLTGNGTAPPTHSVDLTWNASAGAVGYNVYRRTPAGNYSSPINSMLISSTADTDNNVTAGQTYFYVATAVDGNGIESGHSNEIQVLIPTP